MKRIFSIATIAMLCHQANKALCIALGDTSQAVAQGSPSETPETEPGPEVESTASESEPIHIRSRHQASNSKMIRDKKNRKGI